MNNQVAITLKEIIKQNGFNIIYNRKKLAALMNDLCGQFKLERELIIKGVDSGVPWQLEGLDCRTFNRKKIRLSYDFKKFHGTSDQYSLWTIHAWAYTLSLISFDMLTNLKGSKNIKLVKKDIDNYTGILRSKFRKIIILSIIITSTIFLLSHFLFIFKRAIDICKDFSGGFYLVFLFINSVFVLSVLEILEFRKRGRRDTRS